MSAHILVVDPEAMIRELLHRFLTKQGFKVQTVATPDEALETIRRGPIDLVITEISLGDQDGLALLADIKKEFPEVPVIILTGLGFVESLIDESVQKGAAGYVSKVMPLDELHMAVERALKERRTTA